MYEYTDCSVPDKYSYVIKTVLLTFFYTPFVPVVALISFFGFILYYVSVKLLFRYCYKLPNNHSNQINIGANRILTICPLILNIGQLFIFYYRLQSLHQAVDINYEVICYVSLGISILFIFLPWEDINDKLFPL